MSRETRSDGKKLKIRLNRTVLPVSMNNVKLKQVCSAT